MASDQSALACLYGGNTVKISLDANPGDVTQTTLPRWVRLVTMQFFTSADAAEIGYFEFTGTDSAAKTANAFSVPSGGVYQRQIVPESETPSDTCVLYLAGTTASGYCLLDLEP